MIPRDNDTDGPSSWSLGGYQSSDWFRPKDILSLDARHRVSLIRH